MNVFYFRKLLSAIVLLLCSTVATAHDFEVDGIYYNITDATAKTVEVTYRGKDYDSFDGEYSGNVVIPENVTCNGTTYSVTTIESYAFEDCTGLTSVTIGNSVTSIGYSAFRGCDGLTSIIVEEGNKSYDSREGCNAIIETATNTLIVGCQNAIIPNSVTTIGDYAFRWCSGLTSVTIGNSVTTIGNGAFSSCTGLTSVTIPNSVTTVGDYAFYNCKGLTSVTIPNSVTTVGDYAFYNCTGLTSVTIPNSVTTIGIAAFYNCI